MLILSEEQLNNLNKEALVIIAASLQDQMQSLHAQLDKAMPSLLTQTAGWNFSPNRFVS